MSPALPDGVSWPSDGLLSPDLVGAPNRDLSLYIHVPFCRVRCGYCDFNTYTVGFGTGADVESYDRSVVRELDLAARVLAPFDHRPVQSIFFGGGTPTMLHATALAGLVAAIRKRFELSPACEITVEANPDTVDERALEILASGGFTRVSFGMQSGVPHVLRTLERTHDPHRIESVVQWARQVGLSASLDLIYGTPGESLEDWERSLDLALSVKPDHISTYALVIEEGTKMAARVRRGELPMPDPDDEAEKYELADRVLPDAGFAWYEISNWARLMPGEFPGTTNLRHASVHNIAYWRDCDWWGVGPGAHSHVGNARWWNIKHPRAWADALGTGLSVQSTGSGVGSPAQAGEVLSAEDRQLERVMLAIRTADGLAVEDIDPPLRAELPRLVSEGLVEPAALGAFARGPAVSGAGESPVSSATRSATGSQAIPEVAVPAASARVKLTLRGRLLADYVTRELTA
ncbi:MAG: radical SAM family heme chaperone HemW [Actinomycetaceae bacterium]|nr:radical SAM family heme chaperone HemW [Actinomycetaceae bacterium]